MRRRGDRHPAQSNYRNARTLTEGLAAGAVFARRIAAAPADEPQAVINY